MSIQNTTHTIPYLRNAVLLGALFTASGCPQQQQEIKGTDADAIAARTAIHTGQLIIENLSSELSVIIQRFQDVHPATQALIMEPPIVPAPVFSEASIIDWYGTHTQQTDGSFITESSSNPGISILLLNGIDIEFIFDTLEMGASIDTMGNLDNFRLRITSNNRDITTPEVDKVSIQLDYNVLEVNASAEGILPPGLDTDGYIGYTRMGSTGLENIVYDIKRILGAGANTAGATVNVSQFIRFRDISPNSDAKEYQVVEQVTYEYSALNGWWMGTTAAKGYRESGIVDSIGLIRPIVTNNEGTRVIDYVASGDIIWETPIGRARVGKWSGGPYTCDLSNPVAPVGSGVNIVIEWNDNTSEIVMPTPKFNCNTMTVQ